MAYQVRVALDRISFAIKHMEQFGPLTDQMHQVGLQLLHAIQRLQIVDRKFQERSLNNASLPVRTGYTHEVTSGQEQKSARDQTDVRTPADRMAETGKS